MPLRSPIFLLWDGCPLLCILTVHPPPFETRVGCGLPCALCPACTRRNAALSSKCNASFAVVPTGRRRRTEADKVWLYRMPLKSHSRRSGCAARARVSRVVGHPAFRLRDISSGKRPETAASALRKSSRAYHGKSCGTLDCRTTGGNVRPRHALGWNPRDMDFDGILRRTGPAASCLTPFPYKMGILSAGSFDARSFSNWALANCVSMLPARIFSRKAFSVGVARTGSPW